MRADERTIVIRDRRKPNQYTTDNVIAREWLPILRVGDAFFFYSVYLSMANRETESSWGSLRTQAQYLHCGIDLIVRGNKLLEICELIYIESGDRRTSNEYYILDPPHLTAELQARIYRRLDQIQEQETGKNWQSWVRQVRKALDRHQSLTEIWAERRAKKHGRPVKAVRPSREDPSGAQGDRVSQSGSEEPSPDPKGDRDSQSPYMWDTITPHVSHDQAACESHAQQEQVRKETKPIDQERLVRHRCACLQVSPNVVSILLSRYPLDQIVQQLAWLPSRNPRDPAAMLISALQNDWDAPTQHDARRAVEIWTTWMQDAGASVAPTSPVDEPRVLPDTAVPPEPTSPSRLIPGSDLDADQVWTAVLSEMEMQMTRSAFDTWLRGSQVEEVEGAANAAVGGLVIGVRDAYAQEWLNERWIIPLERTLSGVLGATWRVRFVSR